VNNVTVEQAMAGAMPAKPAQEVKQ